jgi:hypothetical protein
MSGDAELGGQLNALNISSGKYCTFSVKVNE